MKRDALMGAVNQIPEDLRLRFGLWRVTIHDCAAPPEIVEGQPPFMSALLTGGNPRLGAECLDPPLGYFDFPKAGDEDTQSSLGAGSMRFCAKVELACPENPAQPDRS